MRTIDTVDGPMEAVVAEPAGAPRGGVLVVQEAFGLTPHIASICDRLAIAGYLAVAPALFHRTGSPVLDYGQLDRVIPHFAALNPVGLAHDIEATLGFLVQEGIEPLRRGVVGFCMGGTVALWAATAFDVAATVTFYGGGVAEGRFGLSPLVEIAPAIRAPWQGHYGDLDTGIPVDQVEALRAAAAEAAATTEIHRYGGAAHGFNCDDRDAFHPEAAALAWSRTLAFLDEHLAR